MKIVHIANFYGPNSGGIKTTLHALGKGYTRLGHEFIYIVPGSGSFQEESASGLKITMPGYLLPGSGGYQVLRSNRKLKKLLSELAPDILEVSDRFTLLSLGSWARKRHIPSTVFSHETLVGLANRFLPLPRAIRSTLVRWHNRKLSSAFDHVVTTTNFAAREFLDIQAPNINKISLGVDVETFHPQRRNENLRQELLQGSQVLIVHCGRLSPEKEPQRSVETLVELRRQGIDARLVIIGMGPMWKKIRELAEGLPIDILGYICSPIKIAEILACADFSLAPGPLETFCLSALESLACGTPVLASRSSAVGELLGLDLEIPAGKIAADDGESFAQAALWILANAKSRTSAREVAEKLPWDQCVMQMRNLHNLNELGKKAPHAIVPRRSFAA